ncbi:MAG TPA: transketolase [Steroidobacteraceae bacterium]|nr:transketolase [Steroidobacteraceae bacterium]
MSAVEQATLMPSLSGHRLQDAATAALRVLAMDAVEKARSGHPGMPMGMAEIASVLWRGYLRHNPGNPNWPNRDRFVLSNGHGSMLLYALLHLTGYDLPLAELARFRQLHSRTPGHPEYGITPGVETTTGPLGQGLANAVGMALAERTLAAQFNRPGFDIIDHRTYVFVGDGCLMEGISHEAASLAGRLHLNKLIVLYDDNGISIDGRVDEWFADDTPARFAAYGWRVETVEEGHDAAAIDRALRRALAEESRPTLICCKTVIGYGAPTKAGHHDTHGAPLGKEEVERAREALGWRHGAFEIPSSVYEIWNARERGARLEAEWQALLSSYRQVYPELAAELDRRLSGRLPTDFAQLARDAAAATAAKSDVIATRKASQNALATFAKHLPELIGGSADLTHSNLTSHPGSVPVTRDPTGNQVYFGVREFGMIAIANGIALHEGFVPYVATFLTFSDYARNAIRMSALMGLRVISVFTHDSIGLGEDGPTHQPIEHAESLRLIPNLDVWRPADATETCVAWAEALKRSDGPSALLLSRQGLPQQSRSPEQRDAIARGGYVLHTGSANPDAVIVATGSEVQLAMGAARRLAEERIAARVVSMPCVEVFERQPLRWRESVIPRGVPVVTVEAGATRGWWKYAGHGGAVIGIDRFGESAPDRDLWTYFELTVDRVARTVHELVTA